MLFPLELGANPLPNSGIALGAFNGFSTLYVGIAEAKLTYIPKGKTYCILIICYAKLVWFFLKWFLQQQEKQTHCLW